VIEVTRHIPEIREYSIVAADEAAALALLREHYDLDAHDVAADGAVTCAEVNIDTGNHDDFNTATYMFLQPVEGADHQRLLPERSK